MKAEESSEDEKGVKPRLAHLIASTSHDGLGQCTCSSPTSKPEPIECASSLLSQSPTTCPHGELQKFWCKPCGQDICIDCWDRCHSGSNHLVATIAIKEVTELREMMAAIGAPASRSTRRNKLGTQRHVLQSFLDANSKFINSLTSDIEDLSSASLSSDYLDSLYESAQQALKKGFLDDLPEVEELSVMDTGAASTCLSDASIPEFETLFTQYLPKIAEFQWTVGNVSQWNIDTSLSSADTDGSSVRLWDAHFFLMLEVNDKPEFWTPLAIDVFLCCDPPASFPPKWHLQTYFRVKLIPPIGAGSDSTPDLPEMSNARGEKRGAVMAEEHNFSEQECGAHMARGWEFVSITNLLDPAYGCVSQDQITLHCRLIAWKPIW